MATDENKGTRKLRLRVLSPAGSVVEAEVGSVMLPGLRATLPSSPSITIRSPPSATASASTPRGRNTGI